MTFGLWSRSKKKVVCCQCWKARRRNKYESSGRPRRAVKAVGVETPGGCNSEVYLKR